MHDRSYAIALVVVLALCCLGGYVAVSGFMNSRPPTTASSPLAMGISSTAVVIAVSTAAPVSSNVTATVSVVPTSLPLETPLGVFQTITASITTSAARATAVPTAKSVPLPPSSAAAPPQAPAQSCASFQFCPTGGPPDPQLAPTGDPCPRNYIWGRVLGLNRQGLADMRIRWKGPAGNTGTEVSKGPPDPPGIFNILSPPPGGTWVLWLADAGGTALSPQISVVAPQPFGGSGICPTRIDFVQQR